MDDDAYMRTGDVIISRDTLQTFLCLHQVWVNDRYYGQWSDSDIYDFLMSRGFEIPLHFEEWKQNQIMTDFWRLPYLTSI